MKIVYIGCVQFSYILLKHLYDLGIANIEGIVTRQISSFNADFKSLESIAADLNVPCYMDQGNRQSDMAAWIIDLKPDVICCFGWPYLLEKRILEIPRIGIIGYHPTALPKNRGRHPIIWALALGLTETGSTFFWMDEGADSGDILHQEQVRISYDDDAFTLYAKLADTAKRQLTVIMRQMIKGKINRIPQDHTRASYWRKRSKADGKIDWRMTSDSIYNLVRALTRPYVGAHCIYKNEEICIWKLEKSHLLNDDKIEPGKILESSDNVLIVKTGDGAVRIVEHSFSVVPKTGEYL